MMKYLALALVLLMGPSLMACNESTGQSAQPKIAVVDVARLMRDSVPGKAGVKFIEDQQKELQGTLDELQGRLEKNPEDQAAMQELQKVYAEAQQRMQTEGQNVANLIYEAVERSLEAYRVKNGYDIVLGIEALASFNPAIDITSQVLAEVDKQKIEFKAVPVPAQSPAVSQSPAQIAPETSAKAEKPADAVPEAAQKSDAAGDKDAPVQ